MNRTICYSDLVVLSKPLENNIQTLIGHGADKIELMLDGGQWNEMEQLFSQAAEILKQFPVHYTVHPPAWDTNLTSENKAIRAASFSEYKKAIEFAGMLGAEHVVIHPGFCFAGVFDRRQAQLRAQEAISLLAEVAKQHHSKLVVENVGYNGTELYTEEEFARLLEPFDGAVGYLLDVGHAYLNGWDIPRMIETLDDRLYAVHLHDNGGALDDHLPIGHGSIQWEPIFSALQQSSTQPQLILEYAPQTDLTYLSAGKELLLNKLQLEKEQA